MKKKSKHLSGNANIKEGNTRSLRFLWILALFLGFCTNSHGQYVVYNSWNFEKETLGAYTDAKIREDFDVATNWDHNSASIANEIINGKTTKVLKITHPANQLSAGFDLDARLAQDFDEVYLSYNFKFSDNFNSTTGGKLPGLGGLPGVTPNQCPTTDQGFLCKSLFKQAGSTMTYHYDRTPGTCPWGTQQYKYDTIYFNNGTWYNITRRVVMNTFTNGVANGDGIHELWVNGRMIFQESNLKLMVTESASMKIDDINIAHFYGGGTEDCMPLTECYGYIDNIKVYMIQDHPVYGHQLHSPSTIFSTPDEITDRKVYYDELKTVTGTLKNVDYGSTYGGCLDEAYLIDAGAGNTVSFSLDNYSLKDGGDFLFFYDGNTTDARIIKIIQGSATGTNKVFKSTGRYLFVRFSTNRDGGEAGWTGNFSFEKATAVSGDLEAGDNIFVFPNPGTNLITINGLSKLSSAEIFDILGRKVYHRADVDNGTQLDVSDLKKGAYMIILNNDHNHALKWVKN